MADRPAAAELPRLATEYYGYDSSGRVTAVCYGAAVAGCPAADLIQYSYDTEGNRLSQTNTATTTDYSYNAADQLTQAAIQGGATTSYTYDANGNELTAGSKSFSYDLAGKVTQITEDGTTLASFSYDGLGNRLTKTTSSRTTSYLWDENASLPSLAEELNRTTLVRGYQPGQDNGAGLDPVAMTTGTGTYYYSTDGLGSTAAITNQTGAVEWNYTYDPYGNARTTSKIDSSAPDNVVGFAGQLLDSESGLYDMRARLYDPSTGRFLSTDPMPLPPTQPAVSLYLYGADDPTLLLDPSGDYGMTLMLDEGVTCASARECKHVAAATVKTAYTPTPPPGSRSRAASSSSSRQSRSRDAAKSGGSTSPGANNLNDVVGSSSLLRPQNSLPASTRGRNTGWYDYTRQGPAGGSHSTGSPFSWARGKAGEAEGALIGTVSRAGDVVSAVERIAARAERDLPAAALDAPRVADAIARGVPWAILALTAGDVVDNIRHGDSPFQAVSRTGLKTAGAISGAAFAIGRCAAALGADWAGLACAVIGAPAGGYAGERAGSVLANRLLGRRP